MNESAGLEPLAMALLIGAVAGGVFLLLVGVWVWERRLVWPYLRVEVANRICGDRAFREALRVPLHQGEFPGSLALSRRAVQAGLDAQARGFEWLGLFRDGKGALYKILYEMWLSRDRSTLAIVGTGSLGGMPMEGTWLYSPLPGGRMLASIDNPGASAGDFSGLLTETFFAARTFDELVAHHEAQRSLADGRLCAFSAGDGLLQLRDFRLQVATTLERQGYLRFLAANREAWRYTVSGAIIGVAKSLGRGFQRQLSPGSYVRRRKREWVASPPDAEHVVSADGGPG